MWRFLIFQLLIVRWTLACLQGSIVHERLARCEHNAHIIAHAWRSVENFVLISDKHCVLLCASCGTVRNYICMPILTESIQSWLAPALSLALSYNQASVSHQAPGSTIKRLQYVGDWRGSCWLKTSGMRKQELKTNCLSILRSMLVGLTFGPKRSRAYLGYIWLGESGWRRV